MSNRPVLQEPLLPHSRPNSEVSDLDALFRPRSVAVIGASARPGTIGREILHNLIMGGFTGKVFPVHPTAEVLHSIKCHPTVTDIPDDIDLAVIAVPKESVCTVVEDCAAKGVGALVIISAGFRETGPDGQERERAVLDTARRNGMRLVGPNCMGVQNADPEIQLNASFSRSFPAFGPIAIASQSGAMGEALLAYADEINLGSAMFVSVGNRADVSANDLLEYWASDDRIRCILLYVESFGNPRNFVPIARRISQSKPIVTVKSGRSPAGARAAQSHTGSLAGADVAVETALKDCGVQRVRSIEEMFDVAQALAALPIPAGPRVAILTNAGGPAILATDALIASDLELASLSETTRHYLDELLVDEASTANPVDMVASATADHYSSALQGLLADPGVDMVLVIFVPPTIRDPLSVARVVMKLGRESPKPIVGCFMARDEIRRAIAAEKLGGIPVYLFPESAVRALAALEERRRILSRSTDSATPRPTSIEPIEAEGWLGYEERAKLAAEYEIPVTSGGIASSPGEAHAIASHLSFPVVMKDATPGSIHKSDRGGVLLDVRDIDQGFDELTRRGATAVEVQRMIEPGHELVLGFKVDPDFGPILMFGLGGIYVEVLRDVSFAVCPVNMLRARELVESIRSAPILHGVRGRPGADVDRIASLLQRLSQLAIDHPEVQELEINPLIAHPTSIHAVDFRVRVRNSSKHTNTRTWPEVCQGTP